MTGLPPNRDAVLEWGVRDTLLAYMARSPDFAVETTGGAAFSLEDGARFTGRVDADGVLALDGSVVLRAHGGALTVPLVGVRVDGETLTVNDTGAEPGQPARLVLVTLEAVTDAADGDLVFATRLARDADALFMYNYLPDSPFDPLRVRLA